MCSDTLLTLLYKHDMNITGPYAHNVEIIKTTN